MCMESSEFWEYNEFWRNTGWKTRKGCNPEKEVCRVAEQPQTFSISAALANPL